MSIRTITTTLAAAAALCAATGLAQTGTATAPKFLVDPNKPAEVAKQVVNAQGNVTVKAEGGKLVYTVQPGGNDWPGAAIQAPDGKPWDLSRWGHVSAKITNTSNEKFGIGMRLDAPTGWQDTNTEQTWLDPGQSTILKVIPGYQYGFQKAGKVSANSIQCVLFFLHGKGNAVRTFTVEDLCASGPAGEKPPADPNSLRETPAKNENLFGRGARFDAKQLRTNKATAELTADKAKIAVAFEDGGWVGINPFQYPWNFKWGNAVQMTVKNTGTTPVTPKLQAASGNDRTDVTGSDAPLAPGAVGTVTVSFIPRNPWVAEVGAGVHSGHRAGTGTKFENTRVTGLFVYGDAGSKFEIGEIKLVATVANPPAWLGKQPPVPQDEWKNWTQTMNENFDKPLDPKVWNVHTDNFWDKRTHFSAKNNIVKNGTMTLKYEKRRGFHNDDPNETWGDKGQTDYVCGHADTYGKWTQRYGYFEARMKLPTANGLWPAFWTMPDRGIARGPEQWRRAATENGGMEFDIMEHLSGWGPYRFNQGFHWDGYGAGHKAVGSTWAYVEADKDDFITIGMLWLPGLAIYYSNGRELGRWESERVCNVQSMVFFYMVSGGWANTPLDDDELADPKVNSDFVIDYFRVWQRNDLRSDADGYQPNDGRWRLQSNATETHTPELLLRVTDAMREEAKRRNDAVWKK